MNTGNSLIYNEEWIMENKQQTMYKRLFKYYVITYRGAGAKLLQSLTT